MNEKKEKSESVCEWCDGKNLVWTAPNELWNEVIGDSFSFLCPNCFMKLAEAKKIYKPVWTVSPEPLGKLLKHSQQQLLESLELEFQERLDGMIEKLADIEHERWAKWQQYMHSKLQKNPYQGFPYLLDEEWVERWSKQIGTDYEYLSEKEKESDREQVRPYLSLIKNEVKALIQSKKPV